MTKYLLLLFLLNPVLAVAATSNEALPIQVSVENDVSAAVRKILPEVFPVAITFVKNFAPKGYENNLFNWTADRKILDGKTLRIVFATSKNPTLSPMLANSGSSSLDAFTFAPINTSQKKMGIFLVILVDKIFYDSQGKELPNGLAKLMVALAHEIYGNVQSYLELDIANAKPQTMNDRVNAELKAFRASIMFLGGLTSDPMFARFPEKVRSDLAGLLPSEIAAYRSWQKTHPSAKLDPACQAMLESLSAKSK